MWLVILCAVIFLYVLKAVFGIHKENTETYINRLNQMGYDKYGSWASVRLYDSYEEKEV